MFEVEEFDNFIHLIANNLSVDSIYGTVWRVCVGALLSTIDAITDCYVVGTYFNEGLHGKALTMLSLLSANIFIQLLFVVIQYQRRGIRVILKECLITLLLLRPLFDAYRLSSHGEEQEHLVVNEVETVANKCIEVREDA